MLRWGGGVWALSTRALCASVDTSSAHCISQRASTSLDAHRGKKGDGEAEFLLLRGLAAWREKM